ncbi:hypothetical protein DFH11DRAFT_1549278 [Phellopilus nigrolimitatus]|nr:hypothetical protein DFH11DRAFT_1549278 [Phellopilus nigrolimitatus]
MAVLEAACLHLSLDAAWKGAAFCALRRFSSFKRCDDICDRRLLMPPQSAIECRNAQLKRAVANTSPIRRRRVLRNKNVWNGSPEPTKAVYYFPELGRTCLLGNNQPELVARGAETMRSARAL